jgi:hypothetical protein
MSTCYYCRAEIAPGNAFCVECGHAVPPPVPMPPPGPVIRGNDGEGASFLAKNIGRVAAIFILIGFVFLPWTDSNRVEKGYELACNPVGAFLWIIPVGAIAAFVLTSTNTTTFQQTKIAGAAMLIAGSVNVVAMIYLYVKFVMPVHVVDSILGEYSYTVALGSGAYMVLAGSLVLGLAGAGHLKSVRAFDFAAPQAAISGYELPAPGTQMPRSTMPGILPNRR